MLVDMDYQCVPLGKKSKKVKSTSHNTTHIIAIQPICTTYIISICCTNQRLWRRLYAENRHDVSKQQLGICGRWLYLK